MPVTTKMQRLLREGALKEGLASEFREQLKDFLGSLERVEDDLGAAGDKLNKVARNMRQAGYAKYAEAFEKLLDAAREDLAKLQNKVDAVLPF